MSETAPTYIACVAGNNALTDVLVSRCGDFIRLLGHPQMDLTTADARSLARAILDLLDPPAGDSLVDDVCAEFQARSRLGQQKYGMKMTRDDLALEDWLRHLKNELMDAVLYAEAALRRIDRQTDDGR